MFYFVFHYKNKEFRIPCKDILYFESNGRKIIIYHSNGETETFKGKMSDVENKLLEGKIPFMRIH